MPAIPTDLLLAACEGRWEDVPADRHEQVSAALRTALAASPASAQARRLGELGAVLVTARALDDYLEQTRGSADAHDRETARAELTELLLDARRVGGVAGDPDQPERERWRVRTRGGLDATCQVVRRGRLVLVTSLGAVRRSTSGRRR